MTAFAAGTVVTSDYLPWARVVAASFIEHHPGVRFVVAVLDEPDPAQLRPDDPFELVRTPQIGLDGPEYGWMRAIYNGFELSCAVKPWLLRHLLAGADAALYLDGDILVCDSLAPLAERAAAGGVLVTPHTLAPPPAAHRLPAEENFLRLGQFNAGFLGVGRSGLPFLDWWGERLRRECADWSEAGPLRFVDQRWLDLAVNYFPLDILRHPGANVAYWNVGARVLERSARGRYDVDGEPLLFMHFSGFHPARPEVLSRHEARIDPRNAEPLRELCAGYAERLRAAGCGDAAGPAPAAPGPRVLVPDVPLTDPVRAAIRAALIAAERAGVAADLDPADEAAVRGWLRAPATPGGTSWYLWGLHASHADVARAFPDVPGGDEERYIAWSIAQGVVLGLVPAPLAGPAAPVALDDPRGLVVLVDAAELAADGELLAGLAGAFTAADDVTFLIHAPGRDPEAFSAQLAPLLRAGGLDGPAAPDLLGLLQPAAPSALAPLVHAALTRRTAVPGLPGLPTASDAAALRTLTRRLAPTA